MLKGGYKFYENNEGLFRVKNGVVERYEDVNKWVVNNKYTENLLSMDSDFDYNGTDSIDDEETLNEYIESCNFVYSLKGSKKITALDMVCFKFGALESIKRVYLKEHEI